MTATARHLICQRSGRRGHSWRELTMAESLDSEGRLSAEARICRACGKHGHINDQGVTIAEPTRHRHSKLETA